MDAVKKGLVVSAIVIIALLLTAFSGCPKNSSQDNKSQEIKNHKKELSKESIKVKKQEKERENPESPQTKNSNASKIEQFAFIKKIYTKSSSDFAEVDYAQFLTGDEADKAAQEAGEVGTGEDVPNDYYIKNVNGKIRTFKISQNVKIIVQTNKMASGGQLQDQQITYSTFKHIFITKPNNQSMMVNNGYWLTIKGDEITKFKEQYVP